MRGAALCVPALLALLGAPVLAQAPGPSRADVKLAREAIERGGSLLELGKTAEALEQFTRARELDPHEAIAPYRMAQCEFLLGKEYEDAARFEAARQLLREAQMLDPRSGDVFFLWGVIGAHTERYADAKIGFEEALKRGFRVTDSKVNLAQALYFFGIEQAEAEVPSADVIRTLEEAVDRLEAVKDDLQYTEEMRTSCRGLWLKALSQLAAARQRARDLPEAEAIFLRLVKLQPSHHLHHFHLGRICGAGKRIEEALTHYRKALDLSPDEAWLEPHLEMGHILSQQDEPERAEKHLLTYLARYPDSWAGRYHLGEHYYRAGKLELSIETFVRCVEIDRTRIRAMYKLAQGLRRVKRTREADRWLDLYRTLERERDDE